MKNGNSQNARSTGFERTGTVTIQKRYLYCSDIAQLVGRALANYVKSLDCRSNTKAGNELLSEKLVSKIEFLELLNNPPLLLTRYLKNKDRR